MARILVVDDDRNMRASLCDALSRRGYEAEPAGDAGAALRMAETGDYQAVITDIRMPGKGGLELLDELKARPRRNRQGAGGNVHTPQKQPGRRAVYRRQLRRASGKPS
ncbi:MAG: response regulator [Nitrospinae bacterium]|nr:response regulator [Nitrospinota bacterium]